MRAPDGRLRVWGTLPDRYHSRQIAASTVDARGRIVALVVDPDVQCARRAGNNDPYDATLLLNDGSDWHETVVPDLVLRFPKIDVLGDGFVLAAARCDVPARRRDRPYEPFEESDIDLALNALVVDAAGTTQAAFHAGDAIEYLMTDAEGTIWTAYFDESSICAPWPLKPPSEPGAARSTKRSTKRMTMAMPGAIRWNSLGDPLWYAISDDSGACDWTHVYAFNVGREFTWAYPYTGFPLVEIDDAGVRWARRTPVSSACGVMTAGDHSAFLTTPGRHPKTPGIYELTLAHSTSGPIEAVASVPVLLPDGTRPQSWARRPVCRDNRMWLQFDDPFTWYVVEI